MLLAKSGDPDQMLHYALCTPFRVSQQQWVNGLNFSRVHYLAIRSSYNFNINCFRLPLLQISIYGRIPTMVMSNRIQLTLASFFVIHKFILLPTIQITFVMTKPLQFNGNGSSAIFTIGDNLWFCFPVHKAPYEKEYTLHWRQKHFDRVAFLANVYTPLISLKFSCVLWSSCLEADKS